MVLALIMIEAGRSHWFQSQFLIFAFPTFSGVWGINDLFYSLTVFLICRWKSGRNM